MEILAAILVMVVVVVSTAALERSLSQQVNRRLSRIEGKIDLLMRHAGIEEPPVPAQDEIRQLLVDGRRIEAIKAYRTATGASLAEAKAVVDKLG